MANGNPFSPRFGAVPPVLGDRRDVLAELAQVAEGNLNSPACATLLLGTRGMGKTTLLRVTENTFAEAGWYALRVTAEAGGGLIEDLRVRAGALWHGIEHGDEGRRGLSRISGVPVAGVGVTTERLSAPAPNLDLQDTLTAIGRRAEADGGGLLVTVDELHSAPLGEIRRFGGIFQLIGSGDGLPIAFVGAGLLEMASTVLSDRMSTFLHRCAQHELGPLSNPESGRALAEPIRAIGGTLEAADLEVMTAAAEGHPYMLQTIGYNVWDAAADPAAGISAAEVAAGLATSRRIMRPSLYAPVWDGLDTAEKRFLVCMLGDPHDSVISDLARRGVEPEAATGLRKRLIHKGVIACSGPGRVAFTHTEARRYARTQSEAEGWRLNAEGRPAEPTEPV